MTTLKVSTELEWEVTNLPNSEVKTNLLKYIQQHKDKAERRLSVGSFSNLLYRNALLTMLGDITNVVYFEQLSKAVTE